MSALAVWLHPRRTARLIAEADRAIEALVLTADRLAAPEAESRSAAADSGRRLYLVR